MAALVISTFSMAATSPSTGDSFSCERLTVMAETSRIKNITHLFFMKGSSLCHS